jgi:hypothetical protein
MNKLYEFTAFDNAQIVLEESVDNTGKKSLFMKGIFIQGEVRNQNKRIYPLSEIVSAVTAVKEKISSGFTVLGELDHPQDLNINLDRASHIITDMWMENNNGMGKLKIVDTPMGQIAKTLLTSGAKLGVSSRGSGDVNDYGYVAGYEIVTVDIVAQPSAPNAYPVTIYESIYNMKGAPIILDMAEAAVNNDNRAQYHLTKEMYKFIEKLNLR